MEPFISLVKLMDGTCNNVFQGTKQNTQDDKGAWSCSNSVIRNPDECVS